MKLEAVRSDLRKSEESFRVDLRAKESDIQVLRSGALSAMAGRQAVLDKRRLEAIDQLWSGMEEFLPHKFVVQFMAKIDSRELLERASKDKGFKDRLTIMQDTIGVFKAPHAKVHKSRPYVSEFAWALFSAYQAIVANAHGQMNMLTQGWIPIDPAMENHVSMLAKQALPHHADYIEKHGRSCYYELLGLIESELIKELRRIMRGEESDKASVEQAARIMKEVSLINEAASEAKGP